MATIISKVIIFTFVLFGLVTYANLSPLNKNCDSDKRSINIEILNSNVTIMYAGEKLFNESNTDYSELIDTRFEVNESKVGYNTSGQLKYINFYPATIPNCFSYKVKTKNQTHIGLFSGNVMQKLNPWIEIVIGGQPDGLGNIFRRNGLDIGGTYNQQQNSLNDQEYRGFWVSWINGHYRVGIKGQKPFMSWHDPNPFKVNYIAVDTCCGTKGHIILDEPTCPGINV